MKRALLSVILITFLLSSCITGGNVFSAGGSNGSRLIDALSERPGRRTEERPIEEVLSSVAEVPEEDVMLEVPAEKEQSPPAAALWACLSPPASTPSQRQREEPQRSPPDPSPHHSLQPPGTAPQLQPQQSIFHISYASLGSSFHCRNTCCRQSTHLTCEITSHISAVSKPSFQHPTPASSYSLIKSTLSPRDRSSSIHMRCRPSAPSVSP